jgi:hypothetical protein
MAQRGEYMITTVTTTTAVLSIAMTSSLAGIAIVTVLLGLIQKDVLQGLSTRRATRLSHALNIVLVPLIIVFVGTLIVKLLDMFR